MDRNCARKVRGEAIDAADVTATTDDEKAWTAALADAYTEKLMYNQKLELATINHRMDSDLAKHLSESDSADSFWGIEASQRAAKDPELQARSKKLDACFADFDAKWCWSQRCRYRALWILTRNSSQGVGELQKGRTSHLGEEIQMPQNYWAVICNEPNAPVFGESG